MDDEDPVEDPFDDVDDPFGTRSDDEDVEINGGVPGPTGDGPDDDGPIAPSSRLDSWRRRSATGAILQGIALGLQQVFEPKRDEPAIVIQTSGDPPNDLPVEADFEYRRPRQSVVNIRPWLIHGGANPTDEPPRPAGEEPGEVDPEEGGS